MSKGNSDLADRILSAKRSIKAFVRPLVMRRNKVPASGLGFEILLQRVGGLNTSFFIAYHTFNIASPGT
jgi:hypothetical protein